MHRYIKFTLGFIAYEAIVCTALWLDVQDGIGGPLSLLLLGLATQIPAGFLMCLLFNLVEAWVWIPIKHTYNKQPVQIPKLTLILDATLALNSVGRLASR